MIEFLSGLVRGLVNTVVRIAQALQNPTENRLQVVLVALMITVVFSILILTAILTLPRRKGTLRRVDATEDPANTVLGEPVAETDSEAPAAGATEADTADGAAGALGNRIPSERVAAFSGLFIVVLVLTALLGGWFMTEQQWYCAGMCHTDLPAEARELDLVHASTPCIDCHGGRGAVLTGMDKVRWMATGVGLVEPRDKASVGDSACLGCHSDVPDAVTVDKQRGLRMSHQEVIAAGLPCRDCHEDAAGHKVIKTEYSSLMSMCIRCHDGAQADAECDVCHLGDPGTYAVSDRPFPKITLNPDRDCGGCHEQTSCDACHGIRMPHSAAFIDGGHARVGAFDQGKTYCTRCHVPSDCSTSCHEIPWGAHTDDWRAAHGRGTWGAPCGCHGFRGGRDGTEPFCPLCHESPGRLLDPLPR